LITQDCNSSVQNVQKRPLPASDPPTKSESTPYIKNTQQNTPEAPALQSTRKLWVWKYFTPEPKLDKVRCTAIMKKNGTPCNALLAQDQSASTKSMSEHLFRMHHLLDPNKIKTGLHDILLMIKKQKTNEVRVEFSLSYSRSILLTIYILDCVEYFNFQ
jgi:hypothetical protein